MLNQRLAIRLALMVLLLMAGFCLQSCAKSNRADLITPPFGTNDNIITKKLFFYASEPAGMTVDQHILGLWSLEASEEDIVSATSNERESRRLLWLKGKSDQLDQTLKFFQPYGEYAALISTNADILADHNLRYAFMLLSKPESDGSIYYARMWICSPHAKKILFLSGH